MSEIDVEETKLLRIAVKTLQNETYNIEIENSAPVLSLKGLIRATTSIEEDRQRLIYRGKVLEDESLVRDYQIEDGHTVHMVAKPANFRELKRKAEVASPSQTPPGMPNNVASSSSSPRVMAAPSNGNSAETPPPPPTMSSLEHVSQGLLTMNTLLSTMDLSSSTPAPASPPSPMFYVGQWVDVKDTVSQWLEATVLQVDMLTRRVFVHYNGWPVRWDEWISFDSPRIAPFRSRTPHYLMPHPANSSSPLVHCPQPHVLPAQAPPTAPAALPDLLPEVARLMQLVGRTLGEVVHGNGHVAEQEDHADASSSGIPWSNAESPSTGDAQFSADEFRRERGRALAPLLDRLGRVLTDLSPLLAQSLDPSPSNTATSTSNATNASAGLNPSAPASFEERLLSLLRERPPSPPPLRAYRSPLTSLPPPAAFARASPLDVLAGAARGGGVGGVGGRVAGQIDVHIHILTPPRTSNTPAATGISSDNVNTQNTRNPALSTPAPATPAANPLPTSSPAQLADLSSWMPGAVAPPSRNSSNHSTYNAQAQSLSHAPARTTAPAQVHTPTPSSPLLDEVASLSEALTSLRQSLIARTAIIHSLSEALGVGRSQGQDPRPEQEQDEGQGAEDENEDGLLVMREDAARRADEIVGVVNNYRYNADAAAYSGEEIVLPHDEGEGEESDWGSIEDEQEDGEEALDEGLADLDLPVAAPDGAEVSLMPTSAGDETYFNLPLNLSDTSHLDTPVRPSDDTQGISTLEGAGNDVSDFSINALSTQANEGQAEAEEADAPISPRRNSLLQRLRSSFRFGSSASKKKQS